jgi:hypothetical protein
MTRRILITGSRDWAAYSVIRDALQRQVDEFGTDQVVVHGAARGADELAGTAAKLLGLAVEEHPAEWEWNGRAAGPMRNQKMVDLGADVCLAFPLLESRGTYDCIERALSAGIPVYVHGSDGSCSKLER